MPAAFSGTEIQHGLPVGLLQFAQLAFFLLTRILGLGLQRVPHAPLTVCDAILGGLEQAARTFDRMPPSEGEEQGVPGQVRTR